MKSIYLSALILIIVSILSAQASAETIIYDNITTSQYKIIVIEDDINIGTINEYKYDVYINNSFYGTFNEGERIMYPSGANVSIFIPKSNINTDIGDVWDTGKTQFYIALMYVLTGLIIFSIIIYFVKKIVW